MTATLVPLSLDVESWTYKQFPIGALKVLQGTSAMGDTVNGVATMGRASTTDIPLGVFAETIDNSAGASGALVATVWFLRERKILWRANDGTITAAKLFQPVYILDNQTVTLTATAHVLAFAGIIFGVDPIMGVAIAV